jgi:hypothetical protein
MNVQLSKQPYKDIYISKDIYIHTETVSTDVRRIEIPPTCATTLENCHNDDDVYLIKIRTWQWVTKSLSIGTSQDDIDTK